MQASSHKILEKSARCPSSHAVGAGLRAFNRELKKTTWKARAGGALPIEEMQKDPPTLTVIGRAVPVARFLG